MPRGSKPHDAAPVYRCDDHWHFRPHKNDNHPTHYPWYKAKEADSKGKFELHAQPVYAQGHGDEEYVVSYKYASGFYQLQKSEWSYGWSSRCLGLYDGEQPKKLWRVEEISSTPWGRAEEVGDEAVDGEAVNDEPLPSYQAPYQPPPSYGPPNPAPSQAPPSYVAPYRAPPSNRPRPLPYSGRYQYENRS